MSKEPKKIFDIDTDLNSYEKMEGKYRKEWVEDSFFFEKSQGKQVASHRSRSFLGSSFYGKKTSYFFGFLIFIFCIILSKIFYLQIIKGGEYRNMAEGNRQREISIPAERGLLYDRTGKQLIKNIPNFSLTLIPQDLPRNERDREKIIEKLALIINQDEKKIREILKKYGSYSHESIVIQENIDYETALSILIKNSDLQGIDIRRGSKRLYLNYFLENPEKYTTSTPFSLSHIIGYTGKLNPQELNGLYEKGYLPSDYIGKTGIEKTYEQALRGTYGKRRIEVNAFGKEQNLLAEEAPTPGKHLKLAIDLKIQNKLEEILKNNLQIINKKRGVGIVMNPQNGEILAMVNLPAFDNNDFSGGIIQENYSKYIENENDPLFNRAIGGTYPSGSTIKPAIATIALEEGIINPSTSFLSNGGIQVSSWFFPDWKTGGHGITNVRKSLSESVNTFYYYIGGGYKDFEGLGVDKITQYLREFNFAQKLGIDLPGEVEGFLPSKAWKEEVKEERWYIGDTYNLSIGQGDILVTPLQITNLTSVIANGGKIYQPHIVKTFINPVTKKEEKIPSKILKENFISPQHLKTVKLGMKDCVDYGSCRRLSLLPFSSGGKTGTAQWSNNKDNHAWFTAFAPYDNPQVVITILVEEGGGGSEISAPIAFEFLNWLNFSTCYLEGCDE